MVGLPIINRRDGTIFFPFKYIRGGVWLSIRRVDPKQQIFTFKEDDTGIIRRFYIPELVRLIAAGSYERRSYAILPAQVRFVKESNGIETAYLATMSMDKINEPGILCHLPDGTDIFVDGNHRYIKRAQMGFDFIDMWVLTEEQCRPAMLDIPEL